MNPTRTIQEALQEREILITFFGSVLTKNVDYYESDKLFKPVLLRSGAEELAKHFGLFTFEFELLISSPGTYHYRCYLSKDGTTRLGSGEGICHANELILPDAAARGARDLAYVEAVIACTGSGFLFSSREEFCPNRKQPAGETESSLSGASVPSPRKGTAPPSPPSSAPAQKQEASPPDLAVSQWPGKELFLSKTAALIKQGWPNQIDQARQWCKDLMQRSFGKSDRRELSESEAAEFLSLLELHCTQKIQEFIPNPDVVF